jgi:hypothetical protein
MNRSRRDESRRRHEGRRLTVVRIDGGRPRTDGALALAPVPRERRRPHLSVVGAAPPREAAEATLRLVIEVLAGTRPPRHLAGRAAPDLWQALAAHRTSHSPGPVAPPKVLRSWLQAPAPHAVESGAIVVLDGHVHALALRLEQHRGTWRCTALETTVPAQHHAEAPRPGTRPLTKGRPRRP